MRKLLSELALIIHRPALFQAGNERAEVECNCSISCHKVGPSRDIMLIRHQRQLKSTSTLKQTAQEREHLHHFHQPRNAATFFYTFFLHFPRAEAKALAGWIQFSQAPQGRDPQNLNNHRVCVPRFLTAKEVSLSYSGRGKKRESGNLVHLIGPCKSCPENRYPFKLGKNVRGWDIVRYLRGAPARSCPLSPLTSVQADSRKWQFSPTPLSMWSENKGSQQGKLLLYYKP